MRVGRYSDEIDQIRSPVHTPAFHKVEKARKVARIKKPPASIYKRALVE
jgi:hypothetical protein